MGPWVGWPAGAVDQRCGMNPELFGVRRRELILGVSLGEITSFRNMVEIRFNV